jgi:hypothetical protein
MIDYIFHRWVFTLMNTRDGQNRGSLSEAEMDSRSTPLSVFLMVALRSRSTRPNSSSLIRNSKLLIRNLKLTSPPQTSLPPSSLHFELARRTLQGRATTC